MNEEPKLLVSDSLKNVLSEEEISANSFDSFITAALVTNPKTDSLVGNLVGIEFSPSIKIDLKVSLYDAFNFVIKILSNELDRKIIAMILSLGEKSVPLMGPYTIVNAKIIEIDSTNKMCVFAVDLFKDTE
ncbi:MAG: hypothetical protein FJZ60_00240 [Chlamydiae bacterium]|nr:hypothetical protein [Chlamydiota bacterium]